MKKRKPELLVGDLEAIENTLRKLARFAERLVGRTAFVITLTEQADWLARVISHAKG